jgi:hypothetical protein
MKLDLHGVKLVVQDGAVNVLDKWDEPTDILDGHALRFQAASGRDIVRMRVDDQAPWSEQMIFIVRKGTVHPNLILDWQRAELPSAAVLIQTLGVQPSLSVSTRVQRG